MTKENTRVAPDSELTIAAVQMAVRDLMRKGATELEAIEGALELYEGISTQSGDSLNKIRADYLFSQLDSYVFREVPEEVETAKRLQGRADVLSGRTEAPEVEGAIVGNYSFIHRDKYGVLRVPLVTLAEKGDYERRRQRITDEDGEVLFEGRNLSPEQLHLLGDFSSRDEDTKRSTLDSVIKVLERETQ